MKGETSDIKINLSHSVYNKMINIGGIFDLSSMQDIKKPREEQHIKNK